MSNNNIIIILSIVIIKNTIISGRPLFVPQKPAQKEVAKFKKLVSKSVNQKLEEEVRKIAFSEAHKVKLSQKKASNSSVDPNKMPPKAATWKESANYCEYK